MNHGTNNKNKIQKEDSSSNMINLQNKLIIQMTTINKDIINLRSKTHTLGNN